MDAATLDNEVREDAIEKSESASNGTFPLDSLPLVLKNYTLEAARSLSVAPEMIVLPVLTTVGAAIGNTRSIQLKPDYHESAAIFGAVVAETGSMKSPSLAVAVKPLQAYDTAARRTWTSDTTVEALAPLLAANPRGLIVVKDELVSLVTGLNQYKGGKGNDRQFYLSAYSGVPIRVDRKGGAKTAPLSLHVPKPFLSVIGCIQPDVLPSLKAGDKEDGFLERLLFAWPTPVPVRWSADAISNVLSLSYHVLIEELVLNDWPSRPHPVPLPLTPAAQKVWHVWHDAHMTEAESVSAELRGFYAKLKGYCARLALIHAVASNPETETVPEESIRAAGVQIDFFKGEMRKVCELCRYVGKESTEVVRAKEAILRGIARQGGLTRRQAQRLVNCDATTFKAAWDSLIYPTLEKTPDDKFFLRK